jgi:hypothetical protein
MRKGVIQGGFGTTVSPKPSLETRLLLTLIVADVRALRYIPFGSFQNNVEAKLMIQDL